jgi:hypothetical protein
VKEVVVMYLRYYRPIDICQKGEKIRHHGVVIADIRAKF